MTLASTFFSDIDTAFETALAAQSIDFYPYEQPNLPKVPCATMVLDLADEGVMGSDQAFGAGRLEYVMRYYVRATKDFRLAFTDLKAGIIGIVNALGGDPTLAGSVRDVRMESMRVMGGVSADGAQPLLMAEFQLVVVPLPSVGG